MASETLSSATSTGAIHGRVVDCYLYDSASFNGSWAIERNINTRWCRVATGSETDLPYDRVVENGKARPVRVTVTSYGSGTLGVEMD